MAELQQTTGAGRNKTRQKKSHLRVDFTPMVDMNMLLLTFFMLATTFSKPQTMKITMPSDDGAPSTPITRSKAVTVYLGKDHKIYYFEGEPDLKKDDFLNQTNFASNGLRQVLLNKNTAIVTKINELNKQRAAGKISQVNYDKIVDNLKNKMSIVMIKPLDNSTYNDMVNALDEMLIVNINKYMVAKLDDNDKIMLAKSGIKYEK